MSCSLERSAFVIAAATIASGACLLTSDHHFDYLADQKKIVLDFMRGALPAFVDTGLNLVDVADVALGHWLAYERGRPGERYILSCENLTLEQIFLKLARATGLPAPTLRLPYALAFAAGAVSTAWSRVWGGEPRVPLDAVRMTRKKMWVSNGKAARELGFFPNGVDQALDRAVEWFRSNGYC